MPNIPPHSPELEMAVLSAWSLHDRFGKAWTPEPSLFYCQPHRLVAEAMAKLDKNTRDQAAVIAQMDANRSLVKAGGAAAVFRILTGAPAYGDPWPHVQKLRELRALRESIRATEAAIADAYANKSLTGLVVGLQDAVKTCSSESGTNAKSVEDLVRVVAEDMKKQQDPKTVTTGIPSLDSRTGGYQHKQVTVFGAVTSWGKSSYAVYLSDVVLKKKQRPLLFSFEDPEELYGRRLMSRRAQANPNSLRQGRYKPTDEEWARVIGVACGAERFPYFVNSIGRSVERVATDIRCLCASEGIDIVLVDYVQAIQCMKKTQDRRNEVTYVARTLTDAIKSSGAAGLIFSQFSRSIKNGEVPTMHDLKESGDLENMAENVFVGFTDSKGTRVISVEKCKDGMRGDRFGLKWNEVWCGIDGEIADYVYMPSDKTARPNNVKQERRR